MEYLKLAIEFIDIIVWPAILLLIIAYYKEEISITIKRISKLKYKDFEANFNEILSDVESKIQNDSSSYVKTISAHNSSYFDRLISLAENSPRGAILDAWIELENKMKESVKIENKDTREYSTIHLIRHLEKNSETPKDIIKMLYQIRELRNQAVHASEFELSIKDAERYILSIEYLCVYFELNYKE